jgi:hypothetical protein
VGPTTDLDVAEKKIYCLYQNSTPYGPAHSPIVTQTLNSDTTLTPKIFEYSKRAASSKHLGISSIEQRTAIGDRTAG